MNAKIESFKQLINKLAGHGATSYEFRTALISRLREIIPFDAACFTAVDPQTLLSTGAVTEEGVEAIHHRLFEYEYVQADFNTYTQLVESDIPVATLSGATNGQMERSARYRHVLQPAGFKDELRAALVNDQSCWGYLTLFRKQGSPLFTESERDFVAELVPAIAYQLRAIHLSLPAEDTVWIEEGPGIMVLSDQLDIISYNDASAYWLQLLRQWEHITSHVIPRPIQAVCTRALADSAGSAGSSSLAKVCLRVPNGHYVTIQASRLNGPAGTIQLAVWIGAASPNDMLPYLSEAYGLSEREKQILDRVVKGLSTKELALSLHISAYTVQDHLKSIFIKTGVTSRRELLWRLFSRFHVYDTPDTTHLK
ncbi:helix-turn-helix transcriptional regulator [Paenibacillus sp. ACRRX]|uniref:helix-turn-helix transcriptional regulator n=1 Tax=Paenibacillus sp. ACRRX TaxID=2918206 RepID=UPI001EF63040|nr:helix-turn-helix transcriptional regulator [Paenibacillus sp. ACRRX]MCG7406846.1 helix-turn-helix transcriptional regulator [Paenibacillus sp. ACRRX]